MNRLEAIKRRRVMGEFVAPQPPGVFLEWIESTGTQYIDTEYIATNKTDIYIRFSLFNIQEKEYTALMGSRSGPRAIDDLELSIGGYHMFGAYNTLFIEDKTDNPATNGDWYTITINDKFNWSPFYKDISVNRSNYKSSLPLLLFNRRGPNGVIESRHFTGKVSEFKLTDVESLHLLPFLHQDGRIGMWDTIGHKFHPNMGTGEFIAGPIKND